MLLLPRLRPDSGSSKSSLDNFFVPVKKLNDRPKAVVDLNKNGNAGDLVCQFTESSLDCRQLGLCEFSLHNSYSKEKLPTRR